MAPFRYDLPLVYYGDSDVEEDGASDNGADTKLLLKNGEGDRSPEHDADNTMATCERTAGTGAVGSRSDASAAHKSVGVDSCRATPTAKRPTGV